MKIQVVNALMDVRWLERFEEYRSFILENYAFNPSNRIENYNRKRFKVKDLLGLFLMIDKGRDCIAAFVSVAQPKHWPLSAVRIGNRTWVDPQYRAKGLSLSDSSGTNMRTGNKWGVTYAYDAQIDCCLKHNKNLCIMSRENTPNPRAKNTMYSAYKSLIKVKPLWKFDPDNYYLTYDDPSKASCWQKIVWMELRDGAGKALDGIPKMKNNEYDEKFIKK